MRPLPRSRIWQGRTSCRSHGRIFEDLLHARTGVEEHEEQRVVPPPIRSGAVGRIEEGAELIGLEVLDDVRSPLNVTDRRCSCSASNSAQADAE